MKERYTKQAKLALQKAKTAAKELHHGYVGTEHILLGLLRVRESAAFSILEEFHVEEEKILELIDRLIAPGSVLQAESEIRETPRAKRVQDTAIAEAENCGMELAGTAHLLLGILRENGCVAARLIYTLGVNLQKLFDQILISMDLEPQALPVKEGNGAEQDTAAPVLEQYSRDLTLQAGEGKLDPVIGRETEIQRVIQILSRRNKNNPCLIGEPGVGKTAIVEALAGRIARGMVPDQMKNKRIMVLDLSGMVAGTKYRGEFEERIKTVIAEVAENKNIILFIDELHTLIGAGGAEGALDASNILKPALSRGEIHVIGATTIDEYRKHIEKDAALERRFQPVMVEEPSAEETVSILEGIRGAYERHHRLVISDEALKAAVSYSVRYINDRFLPDKAIDLMDEAASMVGLKGYGIPSDLEKAESALKELKEQKEKAIRQGDFAEASSIQKQQEQAEEALEKKYLRLERRNQNRDLAVTAEDIAKTVAIWTKIPVEKIREGESRKLARLEKVLHQRVVSQDEAIRAVSRAIKRGRVGLKDPKRPVGSFLFLGPTGVGKTELSKALAEAVFGSESALIRVDMSEYMEKHSISKLIGSPPGYVGYDEGGQLSEKVRRNPYSVILFDEIEKAHPDVFNVLLQVLDDGHITDAQGRKVDFKETCIIMTSNAGAQSIIAPKRLGFLTVEDEKKDYEFMKGQVMEEVKRIFRPEFLNRIDEILVFHALTKRDMDDIFKILQKDLLGRCSSQMEIRLNITPKARDLMIQESFDNKYGARPLKRAIQNRVEDPLAEKILEGSIKRGDSVTVKVKDGKLVFAVQ